MSKTIRKYEYIMAGDKPLALIVMGVSGCGKTTVANVLAQRLGLLTFDADDFHSEQNKAHMESGQPLSDEMRAPWVECLREHLSQLAAKGESCTLAFSGLRKSHRQRLRIGTSHVRFLFLEGSRELIYERMKARANHFMPPSLLESQFATLDYPQYEADVIKLDINAPIDKLVENAIQVLQQQELIEVKVL